MTTPRQPAAGPSEAVSDRVEEGLGPPAATCRHAVVTLGCAGCLADLVRGYERERAASEAAEEAHQQERAARVQWEQIAAGYGAETYDGRCNGCGGVRNWSLNNQVQAYCASCDYAFAGTRKPEPRPALEAIAGGLREKAVAEDARDAPDQPTAGPPAAATQAAKPRGGLSCACGHPLFQHGDRGCVGACYCSEWHQSVVQHSAADEGEAAILDAMENDPRPLVSGEPPARPPGPAAAALATSREGLRIQELEGLIREALYAMGDAAPYVAGYAALSFKATMPRLKNALASPDRAAQEQQGRAGDTPAAPNRGEP